MQGNEEPLRRVCSSITHGVSGDPGPPRLLLFFVLPILLGGCNQDQFVQDLNLGGKKVSKQELNRGQMVYQRYCVGCHGLKGDGQSSSAPSMNPAPRDFSLGVFKYSFVPNGGLPRNEDLLRTLRQGLKGTHMPAWPSLSAEEAHP